MPFVPGSSSRIAGIPGTFTYTLSTAPLSAPALTIYSDPARSIVVSTSTTTPTANPQAFTASYPALPAGTYYLRFITSLVSGTLVDADDTLALDAVTGSVELAWKPSVARVAGVIPQRVTDETGMPLASFTASTVPSDTQVQGQIDTITSEIAAVVGAIPESLAEFARGTAALGAAALVEQSFFSGEQGNFSTLDARYNAALERLRGAAEDVRSTGAVDPAADRRGKVRTVALRSSIESLPTPWVYG